MSAQEFQTSISITCWSPMTGWLWFANSRSIVPSVGHVWASARLNRVWWLLESEPQFSSQITGNRIATKRIDTIKKRIWCIRVVSTKRQRNDLPILCHFTNPGLESWVVTNSSKKFIPWIEQYGIDNFHKFYTFNWGIRDEYLSGLVPDGTLGICLDVVLTEGCTPIISV